MTFLAVCTIWAFRNLLLHSRRSWGRLRVNIGKYTALRDGSDSRSKTALLKECCFGAFFCFDGAEREKIGCYNYTVPCKRLLFLIPWRVRANLCIPAVKAAAGLTAGWCLQSVRKTRVHFWRTGTVHYPAYAEAGGWRGIPTRNLASVEDLSRTGGRVRNCRKIIA